MKANCFTILVVLEGVRTIQGNVLIEESALMEVVRYVGKI